MYSNDNERDKNEQNLNLDLHSVDGISNNRTLSLS